MLCAVVTCRREEKLRDLGFSSGVDTGRGLGSSKEESTGAVTVEP